jgi:plastocyanin
MRLIKAGMLAVAVPLACVAFSGFALADDGGADFHWNPEQPAAGQKVTFSVDGAVSGATYSWDLNGDGKDDATGSSTTYIYDAAGSYTVRLTATGGGMDTTRIQHTVRVSGPALQASFTWSPQTPAPNAQVTFTSTTDGHGATLSYSWDLNGDRKFDDATGPTATRAFDTAGEYAVGLKVTDSSGGRSTVFDTVHVAQPPPPPPPPPPAAPAGPAWLEPFPSIRIRGFATGGGVHVSMLAVRAPAGSSVKVKCEGNRCPSHAHRYTVSGDRIRLGKYERFLPAGTRLEISIWKPGEIGKFTRFVMRPLTAPLRWDLCLYPGHKKPKRCG